MEKVSKGVRTTYAKATEVWESVASPRKLPAMGGNPGGAQDGRACMWEEGARQIEEGGSKSAHTY